jgi:hypothetical protein
VRVWIQDQAEAREMSITGTLTATHRRISVLLLLGVLAVYLSNFRAHDSGDTRPARYLPISLLREGDFDLDEFPALFHSPTSRGPDGVTPYNLVNVNGRHYSKFPVGTAILALPVYIIPVLAGMGPESLWLPHVEALAAALIVSFSVLFFFWTVREFIAERWALVAALVYAFGTSSFSLSSQALWQHGPGQFFLTLALLSFVRARANAQYWILAGFALGAAIVVRPTNLLLTLPLGLYLLHRHRGQIWRVAVGAAPPLLLLKVYNYLHFGSPLESGYTLGVDAAGSEHLLSTPLLEGLAGLLISPGRGLFVYSPVLLFAVVGAYRLWRTGDWFWRYLILAPILLVLGHGKLAAWWGGWCYGPRYLAEATPFLCLLLFPILEELPRRRVVAVTFAVLLLFSVGAHGIGALGYNGSWDANPDVNENTHRLWSVRANPIIEYVRHAYWNVGEILHRLRRSPSAREPSLPDARSRPLRLQDRARSQGRSVVQDYG